MLVAIGRDPVIRYLWSGEEEGVLFHFDHFVSIFCAAFAIEPADLIVSSAAVGHDAVTGGFVKEFLGIKDIEVPGILCNAGRKGGGITFVKVFERGIGKHIIKVVIS